jgi:hypothetical protein
VQLRRERLSSVGLGIAVGCVVAQLVVRRLDVRQS